MSVGETKGLAIYELLQNLQLFNNEGLLILMINLLSVLSEDVIVQRVLAALLGPQIQDRTTDLEKVLGYILGFTPKLSRIRVNKETLFLLLKECTQLHRLLHESFFADKM